MKLNATICKLAGFVLLALVITAVLSGCGGVK